MGWYDNRGGTDAASGVARRAVQARGYCDAEPFHVGDEAVRSDCLGAERVAVGLLLALVACGGGGSNQANTAGGTESTAAATSATPASSTGTAAPAGAAATTTAGPGGLPDPQPGKPPVGTTPAMLAEGDSIFHGLKAGGLCQTCHGPDAKGTPLAPPLIAHKWLTGDGSFTFIQQRVRDGMPKPTPPYPGPMLPMGGAQLTPAQIKSVSAYEYSISHG